MAYVVCYQGTVPGRPAGSANSAKNKKDVEQLLQKIDKVEAAITSAEVLGQAAKQQLDMELTLGPAAPPAAVAATK